MKRLFVSFDLAVKLKDLGFKEECIKRFSEDGLLNTKLAQFPEDFNTEIWSPEISAPLYQQVFDWLREIHRIKVDVLHSDAIGTSKFTIWRWNFDNEIGKWERIGNIQSYEDWYEAANEGIKKAIELISKSNEKAN